MNNSRVAASPSPRTEPEFLEFAEGCEQSQASSKEAPPFASSGAMQTCSPAWQESDAKLVEANEREIGSDLQ